MEELKSIDTIVDLDKRGSAIDSRCIIGGTILGVTVACLMSFIIGKEYGSQITNKVSEYTTQIASTFNQQWQTEYTENKDEQDRKIPTYSNL